MEQFGDISVLVKADKFTNTLLLSCEVMLAMDLAFDFFCEK